MDFEKYANSKAYAFFDMLYKLMLINIVWFFLIIVGFGFLTFLPATFAIYVLITSLVKESDFPIFKSFWKVFKKEYFKTQKIFLVLLLIGAVLYFNVRTYYFQITSYGTFLSSIGFWINLILIIIFIFTFIQVFHIMLYFPEFKTYKTIKYAFLFSLAFPVQSVLLLFINVSVFLLLFLYPGAIPLSFLLIVSLLIYVSIRVMTPKYDKVLKGKKPLNVYNYIE